MLSNKKPQIEKYLEPLAHLLSKVNPNLLTLIGSIPPLLFFVFVLMHLYIPALIALLGTAFDLIDGMIARKYNKVTNFGGFLDSTMDRVSDFFVITAFSFGGIVRWEITAPLLLFSYLTSYTRAQGELRSNNKVIFAIGIIERPERLAIMFISIAVYILIPNGILNGLNYSEWIFIILTFLSGVTAMQRIILAFKKL